jgi:integrase
LLPFIRFCIERGLEPEQVQQTTFEEFEATLEQYSTRENRRKKFLAVCATWNEQADHDLRWPEFRVSVCHRHDRYAVKPELLPATFHQDVDRMLAGSQKVDLLANRPRKILRPTTVNKLRYSVYRFSSASVQRGMDPQQITSLAALVEPDVTLLGLEFLLQRANGQKRADLYKMATMMHAIARDYVRPDASKLKQLRQMRDNARRDEFGESVIQSEMTDKNRNTLRCFEDVELVAAFLGLPDKLLRRYRCLRVKHRLDAMRLQYALGVELLTFAPIRSCNLATIRLDRNLKTVGHGPNSRVHLVFSAHELKNKRGLEFPLPKSAVALLNIYLREARPMLVRGNSSNIYLFPGKCDGHKQSAHMSAQLAHLVLQEVGVRLTAHQFRHLAGFLYLEQNPGCYEVVRKLLGHRSIKTTMTFYACMEQPKAVRVYDGFIERRREELLG